MIRGEQKVTSSRLERAAIVYVRQSTLVQVREHRLDLCIGDLMSRDAEARDGFKGAVCH